MDSVKSILLISRDQLVTDLLGALLQPHYGFRTIGKVTDATVATGLLAECHPDIAIVDLIPDAWNGLSGIRQIKKIDSRIAIVALSMCSDAAYASEAVRSGASGYVLRSDSFDTLLMAAREASAGRLFVSQQVAAQPESDGQTTAPCSVFDRVGALTAREKEVLKLAMEGLTSAQIAVRLGISRRTAESHRANIYKKLLVESHMDLVVLALRTGARPRDI